MAGQIITPTRMSRIITAAIVLLLSGDVYAQDQELEIVPTDSYQLRFFPASRVESGIVKHGLLVQPNMFLGNPKGPQFIGNTSGISFFIPASTRTKTEFINTYPDSQIMAHEENAFPLEQEGEGTISFGYFRDHFFKELVWDDRSNEDLQYVPEDVVKYPEDYPWTVAYVRFLNNTKAFLHELKGDYDLFLEKELYPHLPEWLTESQPLDFDEFDQDTKIMVIENTEFREAGGGRIIVVGLTAAAYRSPQVIYYAERFLKTRASAWIQTTTRLLDEAWSVLKSPQTIFPLGIAANIISGSQQTTYQLKPLIIDDRPELPNLVALQNSDTNPLYFPDRERIRKTPPEILAIIKEEWEAFKRENNITDDDLKPKDSKDDKEKKPEGE